MQLYFDLQFLSLISHEDCVQAAKNATEAHIDPFDLTVFNPYIVNHAKKALLRHQSMISLIIPSDRFSLMATLKESITKSNLQEQVDHNVMNMTSTPRLTLLPVMKSRERDSRAKAKTLTASNLPSSMNNSENIRKERKRSKSPVQKAAANFFEAMSNSWFGGK